MISVRGFCEKHNRYLPARFDDDALMDQPLDECVAEAVAMWAFGVDAERSLTERRDALTAFELELHPDTEDYLTLGSRIDLDHRFSRSVSQQTSDALIDRVERGFFSCGMHLAVNRANLAERPITDSAPTFHPVSLWQELARRYSDGQGMSAAAQQAAQHLARALDLSEAKTIRRGVQIDFHGVSDYSSRAGENIVKCMRALDVFVTGQDMTSCAIEWGARLRSSGSGLWGSRQRLDLASGLVCIPFKNKLTFEFSHELFVEFQTFIGLHAREVA